MTQNQTLDVGDIVAPISTDNQLASGCERYASAIVINMNPFVLVSEDASMRWGSTQPEQFAAVGKATPELLQSCMRRSVI
jgi:hypothetical protein